MLNIEESVDRGGWGLVSIGEDGSLTPISLHDGSRVGWKGGGEPMIVLSDGSMGHARFMVRSDGVYISDLQSISGTRVDGISVSMLGLGEGSVVRLGSSLCLFVERELGTYRGRPTVVGEEMVVGPRQGHWLDSALEHVRRRRSFAIQGNAGVGKAMLGRVAFRLAGGSLPLQVVNGASIEAEQSLRSYGEGEPMLWLVTHIDRLSRALQSDLVRAVRSHGESMLVATLVGTLQDAHAEGRVGSSLMSLVESRLLRVPTLEERREDIPALSLEMLRRMGVRLTRGAPDVFECVMRAAWPGGVRELGRQLAVAFDSGGTVDGAVAVLNQVIEGSAAKEPTALQIADPDLARARLQKALTSASGTVAVAARELRISRQAFYRELRRLDLDYPK